MSSATRGPSRSRTRSNTARPLTAAIRAGHLRVRADADHPEQQHPGVAHPEAGTGLTRRDQVTDVDEATDGGEHPERGGEELPHVGRGAAGVIDATISALPPLYGRTASRWERQSALRFCRRTWPRETSRPVGVGDLHLPELLAAAPVHRRADRGRVRPRVPRAGSPSGWTRRPPCPGRRTRAQPPTLPPSPPPRSRRRRAGCRTAGAARAGPSSGSPPGPRWPRRTSGPSRATKPPVISGISTAVPPRLARRRQPSRPPGPANPVRGRRPGDGGESVTVTESNLPHGRDPLTDDLRGGA